MGKRCVVITGCSSGIGRALCYALHSKVDQRGGKLFHVFATARRFACLLVSASWKDGHQRTRALMRIEALQQLAEDGISTVTCDVTSSASISACASEVIKQVGTIDLLINNAGMQATGPLVEQPLEYFQQVMDTNVTGAVRMTQAVVPAMLARGAGLVVNICSVSSYIDLPLSAVYCASKAALLSLTNCLRMEVQPLGVHVMAVTAGVIESEIRNNNKCDFDRYYGKDSAYHSIAGAIQKRMDVPAKERPIMTAQQAAEEIAVAIMREKPPREIVTGGKARIALLGGFIQKWVYPEFVERKFMRMFGLEGLSRVYAS